MFNRAALVDFCELAKGALLPRLEEHLDRDLVASMRTAFLFTMSCDIPSTMRRFIALILFLIWPEVANGGQVSSAYTTFDVNKCKQIEPEAEITAGAWICKGYKGLNIYVGGLDLRMQLAYGKNAASRCSVNQSFNKFNDVEPTIEWRIENGKALAAIERWHVSDGGYPKEKDKLWLAVTKIEATDSCRIALIDGSLADAKKVARDAADRLMHGFKCQTDLPEVITNVPTKLEDLMEDAPCGAPGMLH